MKLFRVKEIFRDMATPSQLHYKGELYLVEFPSELPMPDFTLDHQNDKNFSDFYERVVTDTPYETVCAFL